MHTKIYQFFNRSISICLFALGVFGILASGGGGGGSEVIPDDDINGVWVDDFSFYTAMIGSNGSQVNIVSGAGQLAGGIHALDGEVYASSLSEYYLPDGRLSTIYSLINGTASYKDSINILYSHYSSTGDDFSLNLYYDIGLSERPSSLSRISGIWSYSDVLGYTKTMTIDSEGILFGSDTSGCIYSGSLSVDDSSMNIYRVRLAQTGTYQGCSQYMPSGAGQGILMDTDSSDDTLLIAVTGQIAPLATASKVHKLIRQ